MLLVNMRKQTVLCLSIQVCDVRNSPYKVCHVTIDFPEFSGFFLVSYNRIKK